jgi:hypothetical protein
VSRYSGQNVVLTPDYLFRYLHTYRRYDYGAFFEAGSLLYDSGWVPPDRFVTLRLAAGGFTSKSVRPLKIQEEINFPFCCDDNFDTKSKFKTAMSDASGDGEIDSAKLNLSTRQMSVKLKYRIADTAFNPTFLPGLLFWFKSDLLSDFLTSGVMSGVYTISSWLDASGNGNHATQATGANQPQWSSVNPNEGVAFSANKWLATPSLQLFPAKRGTLFILFNTGLTDTVWLISTDDGGAGNFFNLACSAGLVVSSSSHYGGHVPQVPYIHEDALIQLRQTSDVELYGYHNSMKVREFENVTTVTNPVTTLNLQISNKPMIIGTNTNLSAETIVHGRSIKEIIFYEGALTDAQADKVELYLAKKAKYGINIHS